MLLDGWAFTQNEKEEAKRRQNRFNEILDLINKGEKYCNIETRINGYTQNVFRGQSNLDEEDIAIFCDRGNTCFGANINKTGDNFSCTVYID